MPPAASRLPPPCVVPAMVQTATASSLPIRSWLGQHPEYLLKQMKNFKAVDGKQPERVNGIMNGMIAAFDEGQMRDIAAYFAAQVAKGRNRKES
jgi:cytochrome c553